MRPRDLAAYMFLALTWGGSFLVLLRVVHAFGWVGAVAFRALLAGTVLLLAARLLRRRLSFHAGWRPFAVVGATTVAGQLLCLSFSLPLIGTAMAAILVAAIPLFSMLISQAWGLERITPARLAGLGLGLAGIVLLVGFPAVPVTRWFLLGCLGTLLASFAAAYGSNYASRWLRGTASWEVTIGAFLSGGLLALPFLVWVPVPTVPAPVDYLYLLILGGVMSALTYVVYFRLIAAIGPTRAISVEFVVTLVAVLIGTLHLQEPISTIQVVGGAVILAGCMLVLGLAPGRRPV